MVCGVFGVTGGQRQLLLGVTREDAKKLLDEGKRIVLTFEHLGVDDVVVTVLGAEDESAVQVKVRNLADRMKIPLREVGPTGSGEVSE